MTSHVIRFLFCALPFACACGSDPSAATATSDGDSAKDNPPPTGDPAPASSAGPGDQSPLEDGLDLGGMSGNLRMFLTDAPAEFDEVWVEVSQVEILRGTGDQESWITVTDQPLTVDLLSLQNDVTAVLGDANLESGYYGQARMIVASAEAVSGDEIQPLFIPSGSQTGIKMNLGVQLDSELAYAVVLDFDALASIKQTGNGLLMEPVIAVEYVGLVNEDGTLTPLVPEGQEAGDDEAGGDEPAEDDEGSGDAGAGGAPGGPPSQGGPPAKP